MVDKCYPLHGATDKLAGMVAKAKQKQARLFGTFVMFVLACLIAQIAKPVPYMDVAEFIPIWVKRTPAQKQEASDDPEVRKLAKALGNDAVESAQCNKKPCTVTFLAAIDALALAYHACGVSQAALSCSRRLALIYVRASLQVWDYVAAKAHIRILWEIGANAAQEKRRHGLFLCTLVRVVAACRLSGMSLCNYMTRQRVASGPSAPCVGTSPLM